MRHITQSFGAIFLGAVLPALPAQETLRGVEEPKTMERKIASLEAFFKKIGDDIEDEYGEKRGLRVLSRMELDIERHSGPAREWYRDYVKLFVENFAAVLTLHSDYLPTKLPPTLGIPPAAWPGSVRLPDAFITNLVGDKGRTSSRAELRGGGAESVSVTSVFDTELRSLLDESWPSERQVRWMERALYREGVDRGGLLERASSAKLSIPTCMTREEIVSFLQRARTGIDQETIELLRPFIYLEDPLTPHALRMRSSVVERLPALVAMVAERGLVPWEDSPIGVNASAYLSWCAYVKLSQPLGAAFGEGISIEAWRACLRHNEGSTHRSEAVGGKE